MQMLRQCRLTTRLNWGPNTGLPWRGLTPLAHHLKSTHRPYTNGSQFNYTQEQQQQQQQQQQQHHHQQQQYYQYAQPSASWPAYPGSYYGHHVVASESWRAKYGPKFLLFLAQMSAGIVMLGGAVYLVMSHYDITLDSHEGAPKQTGLESQVVMNSEFTFADVKGCDEAKEELKEVAEFLKDPAKFTSLGGTLTKGVLLMGPPGTGKTLLAKAVAGEAGVPFFYCSGSEFEEVYVGVGAKRVRDLFAAAKANAPSIVFIDEIDAIGGKRSLSEIQASRMTLNQLLVEMDGFKDSEAVVVIGATNFAQLLDKALTRPGRFDTHVHVPLPDKEGRMQILDLYAKKLKLSPAVDIAKIARGTPGCSGAELKTLMNSAAVRAAVAGQKDITQSDLEYAKDKMLMGSERTSAKMTLESRTLTAYHEGGHALVAINTRGAHPIHKATIMPRGDALGMVHQLPEDDQYTASREQLIAQMDVCMGGRVAEELIFGVDEVTSGASSDLQKATSIARNMVLRYGMDPEVGLVAHDSRDLKDLSPETRSLIDQRIRELVDGSYRRVYKMLDAHQDDLHAVAAHLLDKETLDSDGLMESLKPSFKSQVMKKPRPSAVVIAERTKAESAKLQALRAFTNPTPTNAPSPAPPSTGAKSSPTPPSTSVKSSPTPSSS